MIYLLVLQIVAINSIFAQVSFWMFACSREVLMEQLRAAAAGGKAPSTNLVEARGGEP